MAQLCAGNAAYRRHCAKPARPVWRPLPGRTAKPLSGPTRTKLGSTPYTLTWHLCACPRAPAHGCWFRSLCGRFMKLC